MHFFHLMLLKLDLLYNQFYIVLLLNESVILKGPTNDIVTCVDSILVTILNNC